MASSSSLAEYIRRHELQSCGTVSSAAPTWRHWQRHSAAPPPRAAASGLDSNAHYNAQITRAPASASASASSAVPSSPSQRLNAYLELSDTSSPSPSQHESHSAAEPSSRFDRALNANAQQSQRREPLRLLSQLRLAPSPGLPTSKCEDDDDVADIFPRHAPPPQSTPVPPLPHMAASFDAGDRAYGTVFAAHRNHAPELSDENSAPHRPHTAATTTASELIAEAYLMRRAVANSAGCYDDPRAPTHPYFLQSRTVSSYSAHHSTAARLPPPPPPRAASQQTTQNTVPIYPQNPGTESVVCGGYYDMRLGAYVVPAPPPPPHAEHDYRRYGSDSSHLVPATRAVDSRSLISMIVAPSAATALPCESDSSHAAFRGSVQPSALPASPAALVQKLEQRSKRTAAANNTNANAAATVVSRSPLSMVAAHVRRKSRMRQFSALLDTSSSSTARHGAVSSDDPGYRQSGNDDGDNEYARGSVIADHSLSVSMSSELLESLDPLPPPVSRAGLFAAAAALGARHQASARHENDEVLSDDSLVAGEARDENARLFDDCDGDYKDSEFDRQSGSEHESGNEGREEDGSDDLDDSGMPSRRHSHATNAAAEVKVRTSSSRIDARNKDRRSTGNHAHQTSITAASARRHRIDSLYAAEEEAASDALWRLELGSKEFALARAEERAASDGFVSTDANADADDARAKSLPAFEGGHSVSDGIERSRAAEIASARERVANFAAVTRQRHASFDLPLVGMRERFRRDLDRSLDLGLDSASLHAGRALQRLPVNLSSRGGRATLDLHPPIEPVSPTIAMMTGSDDGADLASPLLSPVSSSLLPPNRASHAVDDVVELFDESELELFDVGAAAPSSHIPPRIPVPSAATFGHLPASSSPSYAAVFSTGDAVSVEAPPSLGLSLPAWALDVISVSKSE